MLFRFEDFTLDEERLELARGGTKLGIQPQSRDVLFYLVKNRHRMVSKRELVDAVWGGVMLSETVLAQAMLRLRRTLEDDSERPRMVETVRGRGYRFVAQVSEHAGAPAGEARPFVGRKEQLAAIEQRFERARAGHGSVALVAGEAGVGKSRFLEEVAGRVAAKGARSVSVYGYDEGRGPVLWPFCEVARKLDRPAPAFPQLLAQAEDGPEAFAAYETLARFFREAAKSVPLVLLVDDLHAADPASMGLLRFLARALADAGVLVVAAYRGASATVDDVLAKTVGAISRADPSAQITLGPLAPPEVVELARATLGRPPDAALAARLAEKSAGSPLLVTQLLHATRAIETHVASTSSLLDEVALQEAVAAQLQGIPEACARALSMASVFGQSFDTGPLATVCGVDAPALLEVLESALRARVIAKASGPPHRYRFAHALVRDLLYKRLGGAERIARHRAAALALLAFVSEPAGEDLDAVAKHFVAAAGADAEPALTWSVRAAESAEERGDTEHALEHLWAARSALRLRRDVRSATAAASLRRLQARPPLSAVACELLALLPP